VLVKKNIITSTLNKSSSHKDGTGDCHMSLSQSLTIDDNDFGDNYHCLASSWTLLPPRGG
jgi:hypothetical protein